MMFEADYLIFYVKSYFILEKNMSRLANSGLGNQTVGQSPELPIPHSLDSI